MRLPNNSRPADENFIVTRTLCEFLGGLGDKAKPALPVLQKLRNQVPAAGPDNWAAEAINKIDPKGAESVDFETILDDVE